MQASFLNNVTSVNVHSSAARSQQSLHVVVCSMFKINKKQAKLSGETFSFADPFLYMVTIIICNNKIGLRLCKIKTSIYAHAKIKSQQRRDEISKKKERQERRRKTEKGEIQKKKHFYLNFISVFSLILLRQSSDTQPKLVSRYVDPVGFELTILLSAGITDVKLTTPNYNVLLWKQRLALQSRLF